MLCVLSNKLGDLWKKNNNLITVEELKKMNLEDFLRFIIKDNKESLTKYEILDAKEMLEIYPMFSKFTLDKAIKHQGLPFYKVGHKRYFEKSLIDQWICDRNLSLSEKNKNKFRL